MNGNKVINIQKAIAADVLAKLEAIDPNCILAGGAPRDWFFNKPANDLDFYIYIAEDASQDVSWRLRKLGFDNITKLGKDDPTYKSLTCLQSVFEFEYLGQRIQVMVMNRPTFGCVIDHFNLDTSKAWWKGYSVCVEAGFLLAHATKTFIIDPERDLKTAYLAKMRARYPDYKIQLGGNYDEGIIQYAIDHELVANSREVIDHWKKTNNLSSASGPCGIWW